MADRRKLGAKDMVMTMSVVLVLVGLIALYGSTVSFSPGGPSEGPIPTAHVDDGFGHAQATMDFPVVVPSAVPDSWHPSSFSVSHPNVDGKDAIPTVRGGWVTQDGRYITLIESSGATDHVLTAELKSSGQPRGEIDVAGLAWTITDGTRDEVAWVRRANGTTFLITGDATTEDFTALADAVAHGH